jgi:hypothetical protein
MNDKGRYHSQTVIEDLEDCPETGLEEINRGLLEADFWTIFRGGGLADRLLVRITYGVAIYQHLSAPNSLRDKFRVADNSAAIGLLSVEIW